MKKNTLLLVSWILSAAYIIYLCVYFSGAMNSTTGTDQVGATIAAALVFPHFIVTAVGLLFNILAWKMNSRGFALTSGILYTVAMILFPIYFMFLVVQMVLVFVGYSRMKKQKIVVS